MTARSTVIPYYGPVSSMNSVNDVYAAATILSRADQIILQVPFGIVANAMVMTDETATFFEVVEVARKPVWLRIDCKSTYASATAAQTDILSKMAIYYSWFYQYNLQDLLKGFFLENFGFDFAYTDTTTITRLMQNNLATAAHINYSVPVFVKCKYPVDVIIDVGPSARGSETRVALYPPEVGHNAILTDYIFLEDPLISSWSSGTPTYDSARVDEYLALAKRVADRSDTIQIAAVQRFDLSTSAVDNLVGLNIISGIRTKLNDFALFMRALGFGTIGAANYTDYGLTSHLCIDPAYLNNNPIIDNTTGYSTLYSREGNFFVGNPGLPLRDGTLVELQQFNNQYAYTGGVIPNTSAPNIGPTGPTGVAGQLGPTGPVGPPGTQDVNIAHLIVGVSSLAVTLTSADSAFTVDCTTNFAQFTLPAASAVPGKRYRFLKTDASGNNIRLVASGGGTINGVTPYTAAATQYSFAEVESNGTSWFVFGKG